MRQDFLSVYNEERQLGIRLPILFESEELIAIDKPSGYSSSEILNFFWKNLTKNQFKNRNIFDPQNIFDLQSEISGILIFAKNKESSAKETITVHKCYLCNLTWSPALAMYQKANRFIVPFR